MKGGFASCHYCIPLLPTLWCSAKIGSPSLPGIAETPGAQAAAASFQPQENAVWKQPSEPPSEGYSPALFSGWTEVSSHGGRVYPEGLAGVSGRTHICTYVQKNLVSLAWVAPCKSCWCLRDRHFRTAEIQNAVCCNVAL